MEQPRVQRSGWSWEAATQTLTWWFGSSAHKDVGDAVRWLRQDRKEAEQGAGSTGSRAARQEEALSEQSLQDAEPQQHRLHSDPQEPGGSLQSCE